MWLRKKSKGGEHATSKTSVPSLAQEERGYVAHPDGCRISDSETKSLTFIFKFFHNVFHHLVVERFSSLYECDVQAAVDFLELLRSETEQNTSIKCTQHELVAYVYQWAQQVPKGVFHLLVKPSD